jgi:hypothetical protein
MLKGWFLGAGGGVGHATSPNYANFIYESIQVSCMCTLWCILACVLLWATVGYRGAYLRVGYCGLLWVAVDYCGLLWVGYCGLLWITVGYCGAYLRVAYCVRGG